MYILGIYKICCSKWQESRLDIYLRLKTSQPVHGHSIQDKKCSVEGKSGQNFREEVWTGSIESVFHLPIENLTFCVELCYRIQYHYEGIQATHNEEQSLGRNSLVKYGKQSNSCRS